MKMNDFLDKNDLEFLENAYQKILGRSLDEEGKNYYLNFLRSGKRTKPQIVTNILSSKETSSRIRKNFKNYRLYFFFYSLYKIPILGEIVKYFYNIFTLNKKIEQLNKNSNDIYLINKRINEELYKDLDKIKVDNKFIHKLLIEEIKRQKQEIENYKNFILSLIEREEITPIKVSKNDELDLFYVNFENRFRGSFEEIKNQQKKYLKFVKNRTLALDCGCGRGEWLEIMKEENIPVIGVDLNKINIKNLKEKGYEVYLDDVINFLSKSNKKFSIITGFHIIEHLELKAILDFLKLAYEKMLKNGVIILETPNPKNITVGACNFYTDLTHKNPIPPHTAKFLLEEVGFKDVQIVPFKEEQNDFFEDWVNQSENYAVIGYKK